MSMEKLRFMISMISIGSIVGFGIFTYILVDLSDKIKVLRGRVYDNLEHNRFEIANIRGNFCSYKSDINFDLKSMRRRILESEFQNKLKPSEKLILEKAAKIQEKR